MNSGTFNTVVALLGFGLTVACGSSDDDDDSNGCVPNRSVQCAGPSGCVGRQICQPDGLAYGPCTCADEPSDDDDDNDDPSTGGGGDASGGSDDSSTGGRASGGTGGRSSAGTGGRVPSGSGGEEVGSGGGSAGDGGSPATGGSPPDETCDPAEMSDWEPSAYVPARTPQEVCSSADIAAFIADCLFGDTCTAFEVTGDKAECGQCLAPSLLGDDDWGALIEVSPKPFYRYDVNVAGCVELGGEVECAHKIQAAQTCAREACLASCSATSPEFSDCVTAARDEACASRHEEAVCIMDPNLAARCSGSDFEELALRLGKVFCGNGK